MRSRDRKRMNKDLTRIRDDLTKTIRRLGGESDPVFLKACADKLKEMGADLSAHGGVLDLEALVRHQTLEPEPIYDEP